MPRFERDEIEQPRDMDLQSSKLYDESDTWPQILHTCRMFHEEGRDMIAENRTVEILYCVYGKVPPRTYVLGKESCS